MEFPSPTGSEEFYYNDNYVKNYSREIRPPNGFNRPKLNRSRRRMAENGAVKAVEVDTNTFRNRPSNDPREETSPPPYPAEKNGFQENDEAGELENTEEAPLPVAMLPKMEDRRYMNEEVETLWKNAVGLPAFIKNNKRNWFDLRRQLDIQKLTDETMKKFGVKATTSLDGFVLPRFTAESALVNKAAGMKIVTIDRQLSAVTPELIVRHVVDPDNARFCGFFGWNLMSPADKEVVLTLDEFDAMAVSQGTKKPTLTLPHDWTLFTHEVLPYFEDFDRVFMWFPEEGAKDARLLAQDLLPVKSYLVSGNEREPVPRPLKTLDRYGSRKMRDMLTDLAIDEDVVEGVGPLVKRNYNYVHRVLPKHALLTPQNLRPAVRDEIVNARKYTKGFAMWKRFEALNRYLGGFRPGELTVLTGPTGIGKTTFLCDYAVDLWSQGVRTLFCSFEIAPVRIFKTMLHQFSGRPLWRFENHPEVDRWVDRFIHTNIMLFLRNEHFEGHSTDYILKSIRNQAAAGGIHHVIIDNLQFMVGGGTAGKEDKTSQQDAMASQFRKLANETGAHVTMVVHPKKEAPGVSLGIDSVSGRIVQDSDTVMIVQRTQRTGWRKHLFIVKNRFGGDKVEDERLELRFNKDTFCHHLFDKSRTGLLKTED